MPVTPTQYPAAHDPPAQHCVPSSAQRWLRSWTRSGAGRGCDLRAKLCASPRGRGCVQHSVSPTAPPRAGWQPGRAGAALRCAQVCRQCWFASRRALASPQDANPLRQGWVLPRVGAGRCTRQRPAPTWAANSAQPLYSGGFLPLLGVGQSCKAWGGHCCSLGATPCHPPSSPHGMGTPARPVGS